MTEVDLEQRRCVNCISRLNSSFMHAVGVKRENDNRRTQQSVEALERRGRKSNLSVYTGDAF